MKYIIVFCFLLLSFNIVYSQEMDSLKTILSHAKEDTAKADILLHLSEICDEKDILVYAEPGLILSEKLKYKKGIAGCLNNIGYANMVKGNGDGAFACWNKSLELYKEMKEQGSVATLLNNIGFLYERQGLTEKALDYYLKALAIREKINDKRELANSLNNLALLYSKHGEIKKSLQLNLQNIKVRQEIKDELGLAQTLNNIALNYDVLGNKKLGLYYLFQSLALKIKLKDSIGISDSYINIGTSFYSNEQYDSTIHYTSLSYHIKKNIGDKFGMGNAAICLASAYFKTRNYKLSEQYAREAYIISSELGFPENIKDASKLLSQIYKEERKFKEAYDMFVIYKQMSDSVNNVGIRNSMVKKQMQYEFDKKDEIAKKDQERKNELTREENRIHKIIIYSVSAGLCLLLVLCIFIFNSYRQKQKANEIITKQKEEVVEKNHIIEEKQKEIIDSINYAKRIQYTLLAHEEFLKTNLAKSGAEHFVYFNPKDIVSGDFYWATKQDNRFYIAVCDSTGHGVPGAFMSLLNIGFLSEAINEKNLKAPHEVFNYVRQRLTDSISRDGQKDGFDGILVCIETGKGDKSKITYAAANNKPILVRENTLTELSADKMPVGIGERKEDFKLYEIEIMAGDHLYLYTDGYADQFGGPKGKKYKYKPLNELILAHHSETLMEQQLVLQNNFNQWRGDLEQVDDVCVLGMRF